MQNLDAIYFKCRILILDRNGRKKDNVIASIDKFTLFHSRIAMKKLFCLFLFFSGFSLMAIKPEERPASRKVEDYKHSDLTLEEPSKFESGDSVVNQTRNCPTPKCQHQGCFTPVLDKHKDCLSPFVGEDDDDEE